jgi:hypothetical protein
MSDAFQFPDWVVAALNKKSATVTPGRPASIVSHRGQSVWQLLMDAAVVGPFLPRDLGEGADDDQSRRADERAVLDFAETTQTPSGVKWMLRHDARIELLNASGPGEDLNRALERTRPKFSDPFSTALRRHLQPQPPPAATTDLSALEATRTALAAIDGVTAFTLPRLDQLDREVEFARLLAQFSRMIGERPGQPGSHRFFGRSGELKTLRDYCEGVEAESFGTQVARIAYRAGRALRGGIVPHIVWGVGGVGKTTLVAKFMLEHVRASRSRWPFAYLDFDRSTVNAGHLTGLLAEMCTQVAAQFADLGEPLTDLRMRLQTLAAKTEMLSSSEMLPQLRPYAQEFRTHIDHMVEGGDSLITGSRPFLLVFDTFEIVQYEADLVRHLEEFVALFNNPASRPWGRLRLIIAGRREVTSFLGPVQSVPLGPLDAAGSASMLQSLASDANVTLSAQDAAAIIAVIAKQVSGKASDGVHPLQLRLLGTVIDQMKNEREAAGQTFSIQVLMSELSQQNSTGLAGRIFINSVLVRRILNHVVDRRVRALADPGLVVRRITKDVILHVMAPSSNPPRPDGTVDESDDEVKTPWQITDDEATDIYKAFSKEVTLIEPDGGALRHRPDVRQEMLPLIRARRPKRYADMHRRAFEHFAGELRTDPSDDRSAYEAIYHGLWTGEKLEQLHAWWRVDPRFTPKIDAEEFPLGSPANIFVRAKALADLNADEVWQMPRAVTLEWLSGRSELLLQVDRVNLAMMAIIRSAVGQDFEAVDDRPGLAATIARLLFRGGEWHDAVRLLSRALDRPVAGEMLSSPLRTDGRQRDYWSLLRTYVTILAKSGREPHTIERYAPVMSKAPDPLARVEFVVYRALSAARRDGPTKTRAQWRGEILDALGRVPFDQWRRGMRILRMAVLMLGEREDEWLIRYAHLCDTLPRDRELGATVAVVIEPSLGDMAPDLIARLRGGKSPLIDPTTFVEIDDVWRRSAQKQFERFGPREKASFVALLAEDHLEWVRPVGNALTRELVSRHGPEVQTWLKKSEFGHGPAVGADQDGLSYAQTAYEAGRFRELVAGLQSLGARREGSFSGGNYPRNVFELAEVFNDYRRTLLGIVHSDAR